MKTPQLDTMETPRFEVTKTNVIEARYAGLPVIDTSMRFMVQVMTPVALIPLEKVVPIGRWSFNDKQYSFIQLGALEELKNTLLEEWRMQFKNRKREMKKAGMSWVYDVDTVKLIECDLLVPKS